MTVFIVIKFYIHRIQMICCLDDTDFVLRGYSSVVEHSTADRRVPSSNLGAPSTNIVDHF